MISLQNSHPPPPPPLPFVIGLINADLHSPENPVLFLIYENSVTISLFCPWQPTPSNPQPVLSYLTALPLSIPKEISFTPYIIKSASSLSTEPEAKTWISLGNSPQPTLSTTHRNILFIYLDSESQCLPISQNVPLCLPYVHYIFC
jgi:hypothetical protein